MTFFQGYEQYSIDDKGRVNIPARMRKMLSTESANTFILTRGNDNCVSAYPLDEWKKYMEKISLLNQFDEKNRRFMRSFLKWNVEVTLDRQNRISIPKSHLELAQIKKNVVILGQYDHIEFWDPDKLEEYEKNSEIELEELAEKVMTGN
jgi:MraZ protein